MATNNLFNSSIRQNPNNVIYPTIGMGNFLNNWQNNPNLVQKINESPYNQGYTNEEITNYMTQGLDFGLPEIAEAQKQWGIRTPKTENERYMANEGIFNVYPTTQNKNIDKGMYLADPTAKNPDANNFINRMQNRIGTGVSNFQNAILGTPVQGLQPESNVVDENGNITLQTGTANVPRQGGIINDFTGGFRENYNQGFSPDNFGRKKNFATRIGEGFGSLARFADSPLGRGLIAYGLSNYVGDTNPLEQAITAGVGRQNAVTADKIYRQQLKQLGYTDDDLATINGNVTKDVYEGITSGMRLGNQRLTYEQLAMFDDEVAEMVRRNPLLANQFVPITLARDVYNKKRDVAEAGIESTKAKTEKTKAETGQVGKPKVTINVKQGGTKSVVEYRGGSGGKGGKSYTRPTSTGSGTKHRTNAF